jgi:hypothetical protein
VSPDGHWIQYDSTESGQSEVLVRPFPDGASRRWRIGEGKQPYWASNGSEVFYLSHTGAMMAASITTSPVFEVGRPQKLFDGSQPAHRGAARSYDVSADGRRFLMIERGTSAGISTAREIVIVRNWFQELARLAPPRD